MDTIVKLNMRKRKILLTSFLSMALVFFTVSCSSSSDNNEEILVLVVAQKQKS